MKDRQAVNMFVLFMFTMVALATHHWWVILFSGIFMMDSKEDQVMAKRMLYRFDTYICLAGFEIVTLNTMFFFKNLCNPFHHSSGTLIKELSKVRYGLDTQ